ncbi:Fucose permease [Halobacillus karajensis]|uniref:H+ Antiporter protein n=1 Tax=Halobacillus karajensis TaxID=195088 RepID=A0A059NXL1_9BACI|nr:MFS transporter [Halobacillus karajensis]CDQ18408.1 H+ Antiporter protein [Halobacillus karajensis]CDQ23520.1 H+ Antiporter protein [Halobacillus karajensis]CDQ27002.1 H+ Antiporter protein [Halobacillus karajensis]SEH51797.1 Fucose permease [Halobacillus karajensis]
MKKHTCATHNIRILFWAEIFGNMRFIQPVLTLFYFSRGLEEALIILVMIFFSTGVLVGEIPTGVIADRFGAKQAFLLGSTLSICAHGLLIVAFDSWVFFLSSFLTGIAATFFSGADEALIYESLKLSGEESAMDRAMGQVGSARFIVSIFVVIVGAILANDLSEAQFRFLLTLSLCFMFVQFILILFIKNPPNQGGVRTPMGKQIKAGYQAIRKSPQIFWMFMNITLVFIPAVAIFEKFDQKLLVDAGLPVYGIGFIYALTSLIGFIAARSIGWMTKKVMRIQLLFLTGMLAVIALIGVAFFHHSLSIMLLAMVSIKLTSAIRYPVYSQLANDLIPSHVRATTISLLSILDSIFDLIIFSTIMGIAHAGFTSMFLGCSLIAFIGTWIPINQKQAEPKQSTPEG